MSFRLNYSVRFVGSDHANPVLRVRCRPRPVAAPPTHPNLDVSIVMASSAARIGATDLDLSLSSRIFHIRKNIAEHSRLTGLTQLFGASDPPEC